MRYAFLLIALFLSACASQTPAVKDDTIPLSLRAAEFRDLPGWGNDRLAELAPALTATCARISKTSPAKQISSIPEAGTAADWQRICTTFASIDALNETALRAFFEQNFRPYAALAGNEPNGLFTGYYEAALRGSRTRTDTYRYPLHTRPDDLVMVNLGEFREELKGQRIAGRVTDGQLKPYEDRAAIISGKWPHNDKILVWVDNAVDAFFVQIQGSGAVQMDDGSVMRIGYAGQNGHIYYAIGRELVKRGELSKEDVSMQAIRTWLAAHPVQADEIMNTNRSYVFFKEQTDGGPMGGEGVVLTPGRSLAIDHSKIPYGIPVWLDTEQPKLNRLMMAQDTGGAIRGAVRGDVFWGFGAQAEAMAGPMKSQGRYWLLLPRTLNNPVT